MHRQVGPLSFDQTHVVKFNAVTFLPGNQSIGGSIQWASGTPFSLITQRQSADSFGSFFLRTTFPTNQRNDQRNPSFWTVDARIAKQIRVSRRVDIQLTGEVFNLLDDDTLQLKQSIQGVLTGTRRFGRRFQLGLRVGF